MSNTVQFTSGKLTFTLDASDDRELFKSLAHIEEVFDHPACGKCESENIIHRVRTNDDGDEFFELMCKNCGHKFEFGVKKKEKTLFPRRKFKDGEYKPNGGWTKYNPKTGKEE